MNRPWCVAALLLVGAVTTGCGFGGEESVGPGITGVWEGEYVDDFNRLQRFISFDIKQTQDNVSGRYQCQGTSTAVCTHPAAAGDVDGLVTGDRLIARVRADGNSTFTCDYTGVILGTEIQGTFTCSDSTDTGTFQVFRS
jgi:hypothetical protein